MGTKELNADLDEILKQQHIVEGVAAERERIRKVVEGLFDKHCNAKSKDFEFGYAGAFNLVLTFLKDGEGE
jgi:hypothetical protein